MMYDPTGKATCDGCGQDVGNGSVDKCVQVAREHPDVPNMVENLHLCLVGQDGKKSCADKVFKKGSFAHRDEVINDSKENED